MSEVAFTKHAAEKFSLLRRFGFMISRDEVVDSIRKPDKTDRRGKQVFSTKVVNERYALRVIHENRKGIIVVITFYPVRRERYGL